MGRTRKVQIKIMDNVTDIELNQLIEGLKNRVYTFGMLTTVR